MIDPSTTVRRSGRATFRKLDSGASVVLHLDTTQYHGLNEVGTAIWDLTDPPRPYSELMSALGEQLDDPPTDLEADLEAFVLALVERDLLELVPASG